MKKTKMNKLYLLLLHIVKQSEVQYNIIEGAKLLLITQKICSNNFSTKWEELNEVFNSVDKPELKGIKADVKLLVLGRLLLDYSARLKIPPEAFIELTTDNIDQLNQTDYRTWAFYSENCNSEPGSFKFLEFIRLAYGTLEFRKKLVKTKKEREWLIEFVAKYIDQPSTLNVFLMPAIIDFLEKKWDCTAQQIIEEAKNLKL